MTTEQAVTTLYFNFQRETGKIPTRLYLGYQTYREFFRSLEETYPMVRDKSLMVERATFRDMDVYQVDETSYMAVGI